MWQCTRQTVRRTTAAVSLLFAAMLLLGGCSMAAPADARVADLAATVEVQRAQIQQLEAQVGQLSIQVNANTSALTQLAQGGAAPSTGESDAAADAGEANVAAVAAASAPATPTPTPAAPSPLPTPEPQPTPTPFPPFTGGALTGEPPADMTRPEGLLAERWSQDAAVQEALGWAVDATPRTIDVVMQPFERGLMIWRGDDETITVFANDGQTWVQYPDTFQEGEPESDPTMGAPGGLLQPVRGFGKLWRSQPNLREQLGWATDKERPYDGEVQDFARGQYLGVSIERIIAGHAPDGTPIWFR